jgi:eukaryotic-like serine/threonine-protein kinase
MPAPFIPPLTEREIEELFPKLVDVEILKSGGEGTVFKANNPEISNVTAIKIYSSDHQKTRTELEVKKLLKIQNPYIVKLHNYGEIEVRGERCFFTETSYINGEDLKSLLDSGKKFSIDEVKAMIKCVAFAIDSLWKEKVVHCDIKPENILDNNGEYVLIDLGMAKHLDVASITAANIIMGTWGYLAPEQFKGRRNITLKADYYALGITAYELLVGYHPFNRDQRAMLTSKIQSFPLTVSVPEKLQSLIYQLTDLIPYNRPRNYQEIIDLLEGV